ncbi:hypothetical protein C8F01DRAFT_1184415 [Mycena amicta]|nr:hypothetical protein C8F01DRAFT_1184415 [Mycena amicta]
MSANSPKLPPELECAIFQLTASTYPRIIPTLLLVAWRVHAWVEPLLYRTIMFKNVTLDSVPSLLVYPLDDFKSMVVTERNPSPFLSVHNCMVCVLHEEEALSVLAAMPAIQNLFMSVYGKLHTDEQPLPAQLLNLPLRHLYGDLEAFVSLKNLDPLEHRCFISLTHLELFGEPSAWGEDITPWPDSKTSWAFLARLPGLTHLAFDTVASQLVLEFLLANCRLLQCLVLLSSNVDTNDYTSTITADPRFVVMQTPSLHEYVLDWKEGTMTGEDYWARAEVFIEKRRFRKIAGECYSDYFFHADE